MTSLVTLYALHEAVLQLVLEVQAWQHILVTTSAPV
jgi:hypothetical protein